MEPAKEVRDYDSTRGGTSLRSIRTRHVPGEVVSHYRLKSPIGAGGMGVVFLAEDMVLHRLVAIKFLPTEASGSESTRKRFLREAQAASSLNHPGICTIHELGVAEDEVFLVMEYVDGVTLRKWIIDTKERMRSDKDGHRANVLRLAVQLARALGEAHRKGIIHRDVKPENIMVTKEQSLKVMDFGLALLRDSDTQNTTSLESGTAPYMSPEQIQGLPVDHRSDIFAFGTVVYEMFCGCRPTQSDKLAAIAYEITNIEPRPLESECEDVDPQLSAVVMRCLNKAPDNRFQAMTEVAVALQDCQLTRAIQTAEATAPQLVTTAEALPAREPDRAPGKTSSLRKVIMTASILLSAAGLFVLLLWLGGSFDPRLDVVSDPPGALVYINGEAAGMTPIQELRVPARQFAVRIAKEGYEPRLVTVDLSSGQSKALSVKLELAPAPKAMGSPASPASAQPEVPVSATPEALAGVLVSGLRDAPLGSPPSVRVLPFLYEGTSIGSSFSLFLSDLLSARIRQDLGWGVVPPARYSEGRETPSAARPTHELAGTYYQRAKVVLVVAHLVRLPEKLIDCSVEGAIQYEDSDLAARTVKPRNFEKAQKDISILKNTNPGPKGGLAIDVTTNKGSENLVFRKGEIMKLWVTVNKPCYLRVLYHLADGQRVRLVDSHWLDSTAVNKPYELPYQLECAPPFGVEMLQVLASSAEFQPMHATTVDGMDFLEADASKVAAQMRGVKVLRSETERAEKTLIITTVQQ